MIGISAQPLAGQSPDTAELLRDARRAESEYEASIRRFAPVSFSAPRSGSCDEIVGRYCIFYETGGDSLPPEPAPVRAARDRAIGVLERAHAHAPDRTAVAFPLVRFLVEAGRCADAVTAATRFGAATADSAARHMLLGFALHAAGDTPAAQRAFESWLAYLPEARRARILNVRWLLDRKERSRYERLSEPERSDYEARLWRYADPLYLTPGNEAWSEHVSRHALAKMLSVRRGIAGVEVWGDDLEQLRVRFGPPARSTRSWRSGSIGAQDHYTEHWDPNLRTYAPPILSEALEMSARLDTIWPLDSLTARSGHAPPGIRRMRVLEHQAAVFSGSTGILAVTGVARLDTLASNRTMRAMILLLDSALEVIAEKSATATPYADSVVFTGEIALDPRARYYSAEIIEPDSGLAARARYIVDRPTRSSELAVSSIQLAGPFDPGQLPEKRASSLLRPLTRPVLTVGSQVGVYAEAYVAGSGRRTIQVQIEKTRLDGPGGLAKVIGWLGRTVGLGSVKTPARLGWTLDAERGTAHPLPVTLDLGGDEPGRYLLALTVRDVETGATATARREILLIKGRASRRP